ncbi:MAG TPA: AI-2E family transporter [Thermoanaerobaculia bacterium]|nr:AI-2E family transporter [Thermoanaerobaculia bacterium]
MGLFSKRSSRQASRELPAVPAPVLPLPDPEPPAAPPAPVTGSRRQPGWRSMDVLRAAALVFGLYFFLRLAWLAHPLLLAAFLGLLFGLAVARGADHLQRLHIPRGVGAALLVFGTYALIYGIFALSAPKLSAQFGELRTRLPEATDKVEGWLAKHRNGMLGQVLDGAAGGAAAPAPAVAAPARPGGAPRAQPAPPPMPPTPARPATSAMTPQRSTPPPPAVPTTFRTALAHQLGTIGRYLFPFLSSTLEVLGGLLLITFMAIYIGAEPHVYHGGLMALFPHEVRPRAMEVLAAVATALRKWLLTQLIAMLSIGVIWWIALAVIGVKAALSLAVIAALLEFIPTIGPILSAVPAVAMGFLDSPQKALLVVFVYTAIQMIEGHLLIPILMKEGMNLPPVLTLLGQALMALVFGFLGLVVAVPLIAAIVVTIKMLYVEGVVGDVEGDVAAASGSP